MRKSAIRCAIAAIAMSAAISLGHAQATSDRDAALTAFAQDLARLQNQMPTSPQAYMAMKGGMLDDWWESLIKEAQEMKQRWSENPYVSVTGFSISLSSPPSIDVDFEFK
ncbi:hypothetical protein [Mesorhizobium sp. A623]